MNENAKIDGNHKRTLLGVTDNEDAEIRRLLIDPATGRLKVSATISGMNFTDLEDVPSDYIGQAEKFVKVNATEDGLEFADVTVTTGDLTEATSSVLTITGGTDAVFGAGTTIQVKQASTSQSGYLSSTDWNTFNNKIGTDELVKYDVSDPTAGYVADKVVAGTGISVAEGTGATENKLVITNSSPDQTVSLSEGSNILITGTYPDFTVSSTLSGGGANGRLYYPQNSQASDLTGYKVASTTPSSGATSDVTIVCPTQNAYVLGEEFATASGEPNTTSLPAGTAVRFLFASTSGGTGQIKVDLFQYKTTGDVATTGAVSLTYTDNGASADTITRGSGSFITDGFTNGAKITVTGTANNNGTYTVQTVEALTLTLILSDTLVNETVSSTITTKEKLLRTGASPAFTNTATDLIQFFYSDSSAYALSADDRIIFKWWARRTSVGVSQTITIGTEGLTSASYIQTTLPVNLGIAQGTSLQLSGLTASEILATDASKNLVSLAVATYPSLTELSYVKGVTSAIQTQLGTKAPTTSPTFATSITGSYLTASEILITDGSKNIVSAPVATYPSLTELTYVKGVTSAIQTQIGTKAPSANPTFTGTVILPKTIEIQDTSADHQYVLAVSELTADRIITLPLLTGTDTFVFQAHTQTLTNKRITERVVTTTDDATAVIGVDVTDQYQLTAVANATEFSTTGTPTAGQKLIIRFKDAGVAKAITWDAVFRAIGVTLPTTTVANKTTYVGCIYNLTDTKWDAVAVTTEA